MSFILDREELGTALPITSRLQSMRGEEDTSDYPRTQVAEAYFLRRAIINLLLALVSRLSMARSHE